MQAVIDRLETVPALARRVHRVAKLAELTSRGAATPLSQGGIAAYVLSLGLRGGEPDAATGLFRQPLDRLVGVVLAVSHAADPTGGRAADAVDALVEAVLAALCGWSPFGADGAVLALVRGELVSVDRGTITFQLDFSLSDQLRIAA